MKITASASGWSRSPGPPWAIAAAGAYLLAACATPGTDPHDMSAAAHHEEATGHEREAEAHAARYDPDAERGRRVTDTGDSSRLVKWTIEYYNPTAVHQDAAERHREHAQEHRKAAGA